MSKMIFNEQQQIEVLKFLEAFIHYFNQNSNVKFMLKLQSISIYKFQQSAILSVQNDSFRQNFLFNPLA